MAPPRCGQSKHFACPCARRVLGERPAQKDCRFLLRVRCPPTAFPAAPSPRTETSARPVSKSSSKEDYTIQRPSKRPHIGRGAAQTIRPKPVTPMSESGAPCRRRFPVGANPIRQPLQPEAIGAVMEVTKWLKPSISVSQIDGSQGFCCPDSGADRRCA
jgi:hypothetical protein